MATLVIDIEAIPADIPAESTATICVAAAKREQKPDEFMALCPALARVVCVGMLSVETGQRRAYYDAALLDLSADSEHIACDGEAELLSHAHTALARYQTIVGFNSRGYDLPVLIHRAKLHDIAPAPIVMKCAFQKPWESRPHIDMLSELTLGGAASKYSLAVYCIAFGIPSPKTGGDGSHVLELVKARKGEELCGYCLGDVIATEALARKWGAL